MARTGHRQWLAPGEKQQIIVMAVRDDGTTQDVTQYARYSSNDDLIAEVDDDGMLTSSGKGETSVMIRYLGGVGVVRVKVPRDPVPDHVRVFDAIVEGDADKAAQAMQALVDLAHEDTTAAMAE